MDNQIAQFIDQYSDSEQASEEHSDFIEDDLDLLTPWEEFCNNADAWARHAQASNGFCGI